MEGAKEKISDMGAAARSGMEKTKASVQEQGERMTTRDPLKKDMATAKKDERKDEAELQKQAAYDQNAAEKQARHGTTTGAHGTTGSGTGYGTGPTY